MQILPIRLTPGQDLRAALEAAVLGGHVAPGCIVRTTAEVLLALKLVAWSE